MMSMVDLVAISVEIPRIDSGCSLQREFTELICTNLGMVLYQMVDQVYSCHDCVFSPLT